MLNGAVILSIIELRGRLRTAIDGGYRGAVRAHHCDVLALKIDGAEIVSGRHYHCVAILGGKNGGLDVGRVRGNMNRVLGKLTEGNNNRKEDTGLQEGAAHVRFHQSSPC